MRVAFVLPAPVRVPMGGAAVVYRHAQALAARGHAVRVVAPRTLGRGGAVRSLAVAARDRLQGVPGRPYYTAPGVETVEPARLRAGDMTDCAVIATGLQTVRTVLHLAGPRGWWFVQGEETFVDPKARAAWRLGLRHIACASWLAHAIQEEGGEVAGIVPNAVDTDVFDLQEPVSARRPSVLALYHRHPVKGPETLMATLDRLRAARPDATLTLFSARAPSHRVPQGVDVVVRPSPDQLRRLYNESAVFLHTSRREGWALTPMEAAVCGCAVVATDSLGPSEYLAAGHSMRLHAVGDAEGLAASVLELLADGAQREALASAGRRAALRFRWADSTDRLEAILRAGGGTS